MARRSALLVSSELEEVRATADRIMVMSRGGVTAEFDAAMANAAYERAAELYRGELLAGLYDEWIEEHRARYRQKHAEALSALIRQYQEARDFPAALRHAEALLAADPLAEASWQKVIRLHLANGDRASANRAYERTTSGTR